MDQHEKAQVIRLLDVFGIGPLMIYAGYKADEQLSKSIRAALIATGIATIGYNGRNYLLNEAERRERQEADLDTKLNEMVGDVEG